MKLKLILSTMIAAVAMMANAQDTKRADVKAEAKAAKAAGEIAKGDVDKTKPAKSTKARADVKAEAKAANKAGEIQKGEVSK